MTHLSGAEFVDLLDGRLLPARLRHLESCAVCREQAENLRAMLAKTFEVQVPEPSPLFWDHFSARVDRAIHTERPARRAAFERLRASSVVQIAAAAVAVLVVVVAISRVTLRQSSRHAASVAARSPGTYIVQSLNERPDDVETDQAWALVRSLADDVEWDEASDAGISAQPGSAERAVLDLTAAERSELARLLHEELRRSGA